MQNLDCRRSAPGATSRPAAGGQASRRLSTKFRGRVRVRTTWWPSRARPAAARRAACSVENRPKTADPLPDIRASSAPAAARRRRMAPTAWWRRSTGPSRSLRPPSGCKVQGAGSGVQRCGVRRSVLGQPAIGVRRGDAKAGQHDDDMPSRPVHQRVELLAAAEAKRRAADEKEGHVRSERRGNRHQVGERGWKAPHPAQAHQRGRRVAAATAQTGPRRECAW